MRDLDFMVQGCIQGSGSLQSVVKALVALWVRSIHAFPVIGVSQYEGPLMRFFFPESDSLCIWLSWPSHSVCPFEVLL